jgi:hypothetical protein
MHLFAKKMIICDVGRAYFRGRQLMTLIRMAV